MKLFFACCFAAVATLVARAEDSTVTIEGRVALPAPAPGTPLNQRYDIVTSGTAVATNPPLAVVYLEGEFTRPATPATAQMVQKDLSFSPALLPVQVGTRVEFPNHDDTFHNVFSFSKTKRFDLGRYRPNEEPVPSQIFDKPGLVTLRCEIHEHMRGLILVLTTPYFVVTQPDGHYRLSGLPAGKYMLKAWVDSETTRGQSVDLSPGQTLRVDFP